MSCRTAGHPGALMGCVTRKDAPRSGALPAKKRLSRAGAWVVGWLVHLRRIVWFWKAAFVRPAVLTGNASAGEVRLWRRPVRRRLHARRRVPRNYGYPPNASIDYYASKGMGVIRLPFLWERVQPVKERPAGRHGDVPHRSGGRSRHRQGPEGRPRRSQRRLRLRRVDRWPVHVGRGLCRPVGQAGDALQGQARRAVHAHERAQRPECAAVAAVGQRSHRGDPRHRCHADHRRAGQLLRRRVDVDGHRQCRCGRLRRRSTR